jgi:lipoate-protein ligase B
VTNPAIISLEVQDLGSISYAEALVAQRRLQQQVINARDSSGPTVHQVLLLEHDPPVITVSRRRGARDHLLADENQLSRAGVEVVETDRGGDITYHGPGQLIVYPILDLNALHLRLHGYMRLLEQIMIDVLDSFGVAGARDPDATGVWVGGRKIGAIGVRVSRWVSMHGLALNVTTNLNHFDLIVPCGLAGRGVTSLQCELGEACPTMEQVKAAMATRFRAIAPWRPLV